jgi:arsenate reductase-like glutaredoxin family protein
MTNTTNNTTTKTTQREVFERMLTYSQVQADAEAVELINKKLDQLNKKRTSGVSEKVQAERAALMNEVAEALNTINRPVTVTELLSVSPLDNKYSNQRITAILNKMIGNGLVVRTIEKKRSYFSLVSAEK